MTELKSITRKTIRQALRQWHRARALGALPLAQLKIVDTQRNKAGYAPTPTGYGVAAREIIRDALQTLKPTGDPAPLEKNWRPYLIIQYRYLDQYSPPYILEQLGVARSTFDHEQTRAFDALADILRQWEQAASIPAETTPPPADSPRQPSAPFMAPPRPAAPLVGRADLLRALRQQILNGQPVALSGLPGVGKTALALALAHDPEILARYTGGILWAGLGREPNLLTHLAAWGAAAGLPPEQISQHTTPEASARAVHAAIGLRRMLIIIDDAWNEADALTFKIGGPHCAYLLTTRLPRVALDFAGNNARPLRELPPEAGRALIAGYLPDWVGAQPEDAASLVEAAGGLPLALTLMGRYLRKEAHYNQPRRMKAAVQRLQQTSSRQHLAQPHSPLEGQQSLPHRTPHNLQNIIAISTDALPAATQQALWMLSIFPPRPNTFSEEAALAVTAVPAETLDTLADTGLLESAAPGRYTLHQTIAAYAGLHLGGQLTARGRMVVYFTGILEQEKALAPDIENIHTALTFAHEYGMPAELLRGANAFAPFLETRGLFALAETHLCRAEEAARTQDDTEGLTITLKNLGRLAQRRGDYAQVETRYQEGMALALRAEQAEHISAFQQGLGLVAYSRGDYPQAERHYREALELARETADTDRISALLSNLGALVLARGDHASAETCFREGLALARDANQPARINAFLTNLGVIAAQQGDYVQAETFFRESLALSRKLGHRQHVSHMLTNLGALATDHGELKRARAYFEEGLALARELGQRPRVAHLLANLGALATESGDYELAQADLDEGLALAREIEHRAIIGQALTNLGALQTARNDYTAAAQTLDEAVALAREMGHQQILAGALSERGNLHLAQDDTDAAARALGEALDVARAVGAHSLIAAASYGLARVAAAQGDPARARQLADDSLAIFAATGHPRAEEIRTWLGAL